MRMSALDCILSGIPYEYNSLAYEEYEEEIPEVEKITVRNIDYVMGHCRIPFDHVGMTEVLGLFLKHKDLQRHLSATTIKLLEKEGMEHCRL